MAGRSKGGRVGRDERKYKYSMDTVQSYVNYAIEVNYYLVLQHRSKMECFPIPVHNTLPTLLSIVTLLHKTHAQTHF